MSLNAISNKYLPQIDFFQSYQSKPTPSRFTVLKSDGFSWKHLFFPPLLIFDLFSNCSKQKDSRYKSIIDRLEKAQPHTISEQELEKFLNEVENGTFEKVATDKEILKVTHLLINYARTGTQDPTEKESVEQDVQQLFALDNLKFSPNRLKGEHLCCSLEYCYKKNGKKSNIFQKFGKFVKKHRKAIIITAVIVVAVAISVGVGIAIAKGAGATAAAQGATAATGALAGAISTSQPKKEEETQESEPNNEKVIEGPPPKIEPEVKVINPEESGSTSKIDSIIKETLIQNTPHSTENNSTLHKNLLNPIAEVPSPNKDTIFPENYPLTPVSLKPPKVNPILDPKSIFPHSQYPNIIKTPDLNPSYQVTKGVTGSAIITNIEKTKQKIQTYGNQLADELKINATTIGTNLTPIITGTGRLVNNKEGNIAILQNLARSVDKIDKFTNFPFAPYPLDYEYVSNTDFDSLIGDRHYNHFIQDHPHDQIKQKYFSDRKDISLSAIKGRIVDGRGLENDLNTLDYCKLDSLNLLAHMNSNDFAIPSRTTRVISLNRPELENHKIIVVGGILTAESGTRKIMTKVSDENGGCNVYGICKPTFGAIIDVIRAGQALFKCTATEPAYVLKETISTFLNQDPKNTITTYGHSYGEAMKRSGFAMTPQELLPRINSYGVAPLARIVSPDMNSVQHLVSNGDFVHCFDVLGEQAALDTTIFLDPHPNSEYIDHGALSKTFEPHLKIITKNIKKGPLIHE